MSKHTLLTDIIYLELKKVRDWLSDRNHWTKGAMWRNPRGQYTSNNEEVKATCLVGAFLYLTRKSIMFTSSNDGASYLNRLISDKTRGEFQTVTWNDDIDRTHGEVLAILDEAIQRREAEVLNHANME